MVWHFRDVWCVTFQIKLVIDWEVLSGSVILSEDIEYHASEMFNIWEVDKAKTEKTVPSADDCQDKTGFYQSFACL